MKIGFVGLGIMGRPMARNLLKAGFPVIVWGRRPEVLAEMKAAGAQIAGRLGQVGAESDIIVTMLPNSPEVREVVLGAGGLKESARPGTLVIDMTSIAPEESRKIAAELEAVGQRFLDAPVSGGEPKAIDGTMSIMVGGREEDFERARPVLTAMGSNCVLVGPQGAGSTAKLVNQIIVAANIAGLAEGLTLAQKSGADPVRILSAIRGGLAESTIMANKGLMMLQGEYPPGGQVDLHSKDLVNALAAGEAAGVPLILTRILADMFQYLQARGLGKIDHSGLKKYYDLKLADLKGLKCGGAAISNP